MEWRQEGGPGKRIVLRLDQGDEVVASLKGVCAKEGVSSAAVMGIGACRRAEIAHYDTKAKRYHGKAFEGMLEILSLSGNIALKEGSPFPHLHISLGLPDFSVVGGHLVSCEVNPTCEMVIFPIAAGMERRPDAKSGLALLDFGP
jgi:uncharacterized protein